MSGPKLSQAEIEKRRQQQLEAQRNLYLHGMSLIFQEREKIIRWLQSKRFQSFSAASPYDAKQLKTYLLAGLDQLEDLPVPDIQLLASYEHTLHDALERQKMLLKSLWVMIEKEEMRQKELKEKEEMRQNVLKERDMAVDNELSIARLIHDVGSVKPVAPEIIGFCFDCETQLLQTRLLALISLLQNNTDMNNERMRFFVENAARFLFLSAKDPQLSSKKAVIRQKTEQILNNWQELVRQEQEYDILYNEYIVLTGILGINPKPRDTFKNNDSLQKEVTVLRSLYRKKDEMDYIASQINKVMVELGYRFVSSTVLTREDGSEYDYSLYQADEEAGISIYTNENGSVMMQVTNLGEGAVTPQDEEDSYQMQLDFCASHPDIVEALREKGVLLKQIRYLPPSRKYTKKQKTSTQASGAVIDRRKRRRHGKKVRYMQ